MLSYIVSFSKKYGINYISQQVVAVLRFFQVQNAMYVVLFQHNIEQDQT